ncbi:signal transduction histidine kinase [Salirhabdus euzebyi]|uniref:histidine kinase n=1 Tax=Salirhabdus euzebyi TaxID=394506 RepID=A0A841Q9G8_9BACI|nr:sensor histidine kinase [Salirhabdus euzebyi]MBB6455329.1 signal transduction histidine kinase [Salirhabdus euzebyi]
MGIKWKSKKIIIIACILFSYGLSGIGSFFLKSDDYLNEGYFYTDGGMSDFNIFLHLLAGKLLDFTKEEAVNTVSVKDYELQDYRIQFDLTNQLEYINDDYQYRIEEAKTIGDDQAMTDLQIERDNKILEFERMINEDDYLREKIMKDKLQEIEQFYDNLEKNQDEFVKFENIIKYKLRNTESGKLYTNVNENREGSLLEQVDEKKVVYAKEYPAPKNGLLNTTYDLSPALEFASGSFEGEIVVVGTVPEINTIFPNYGIFKTNQKTFFIHVISGILSFLISLFLFKKGLPFQQTKRKSFFPIDISIGLLFLISGISLHLLYQTSNFGYGLLRYMRAANYFIIFEFIPMMLLVSISLLLGIKIVSRLKNFGRLEWQNSFLNKVIQTIKTVIRMKGFAFQIILLVFIVFILAIGPIAAYSMETYNWTIALFYFFFFIIGVVPLLVIFIRQSKDLSNIIHHTSHLVKGNLDNDLYLKDKSPLSKLAQNINTLKQGVIESLSEQAKSERLKTELITNVSHDLRTPLTSIITYTKLLQDGNLTENESKEFLAIIDRKSKRLNVLINDLFEASKMASGNIELNKETVDLIQLMNQALAEEDISQAPLHFRVTSPDTPIYAHVDGQRLWRVFDNIINNILKYALENTRVYITVLPTDSEVTFTFKNVSKYELNENAEELTERFKRGDKSRSTEGSGLGLAIAKSIVDLHNGTFDIEVDGDLFKLKVTLPTIKKDLS